MFLSQISLVNFKNYEEGIFTFSPRINCIVGNNGSGKTNILDAIHYLSFCKSYFNPIDSQNIKFESPFFLIQGQFTLDNGNIDEVYCGLKRAQKKIFKRNNREYERLSEHIGLYPLVMATPSDMELITDGSEYRRKFIDSIISQYDKVYLESLIAYNKVLAQRNAMLKHGGVASTADYADIEIWDDQLVAHGEQIAEKRKKFLTGFSPLFKSNYQFISESAEDVSLTYEQSFTAGEFKNELSQSYARDKKLQHTTIGTHRDDLEFLMNGNKLKKYASQGQQKSYLLALKLAQFEFMKLSKSTNPLLLLDDIYDKLDEKRFRKLINKVCGDGFGQVFITDTHLGRMEKLLGELKVDKKIFSIEKGTYKELTHEKI